MNFRSNKLALIEMLITVLKPTSGNAEFNSFDIIKQPQKIRQSIGIVFQELISDIPSTF